MFYLYEQSQSSTDWNTWLLLAQTLILSAGLVSLCFMHRQEKLHTTITLHNRLFDINKIEIENPNLFILMGQGVRNAISDDLEERRLKHYMFAQFSMYEEMFVLRNCCGKELRKQWEQRFVNLVCRKPRLRDYWENDYRNQCSAAFKKYIEKNIRNTN